MNVDLCVHACTIVPFRRLDPSDFDDQRAGNIKGLQTANDVIYNKLIREKPATHAFSWCV